MSPVERLPTDALYRRPDPPHLDFATTADLTPSDQPVGQPRAVAAVRFGVAVRDQGDHIFALGPNGTGKRHFLTGFLTTEAATRPLPGDLVHLNDFEDPSRPIAVRLPPGRAVALRTDMLCLVQEVSVALPAAFEAEEYHTRLRAIEEAFKADTTGRLEELRQRAAAERIAMVQTPEGMLFAPTRAGEALGPDAVAQLPDEERRRLEERIEALRRDLIENTRDVMRLREHQQSDPFAGVTPRAPGDLPFWRRYRLNVRVDRSGERGAPVVFEDHPTFQNLVGRIDHVPHQGALVTDFTLGRGDVLDIEREVELGGPLHSKGVLILSSLLAARFAAGEPLMLVASLVFEQSYGPVEGDSASAAKLFALLSAIAEAPVQQSLAVTGSINQFGQVQPVGGVNEKVEGFFELCAARGLTGDQDVLLPAPNARQLMLRRDVIEAVAEGRFHVYPIRDRGPGRRVAHRRRDRRTGRGRAVPPGQHRSAGAGAAGRFRAGLGDGGAARPAPERTVSSKVTRP